MKRADLLNPDVPADARAKLLKELEKRIISSLEKRGKDVSDKFLTALVDSHIAGKAPTRSKLAKLVYAASRPEETEDPNDKVASAVTRLRISLAEYFKANLQTEPVGFLVPTLRQGEKGYRLDFYWTSVDRIQDLVAYFWNPYLRGNKASAILLFGLPFNPHRYTFNSDDTRNANYEFGYLLEGLVGFLKLLHQKNRWVSIGTYDNVFERVPPDDSIWERHLLIATTNEEQIHQYPIWNLISRCDDYYTMRDDGAVFRRNRYGSYRRDPMPEPTETLLDYPETQDDSSVDIDIDGTRWTHAIVSRVQGPFKNAITVVCTSSASAFAAVMKFLLSPDDVRHAVLQLTGGDTSNPITASCNEIMEFLQEARYGTEVPSGWQLLFELTHKRGPRDERLTLVNPVFCHPLFLISQAKKPAENGNVE